MWWSSLLARGCWGAAEGFRMQNLAAFCLRGCPGPQHKESAGGDTGGGTGAKWQISSRHWVCYTGTPLDMMSCSAFTHPSFQGVLSIISRPPPPLSLLLLKPPSEGNVGITSLELFLLLAWFSLTLSLFWGSGGGGRWKAFVPCAIQQLTSGSFMSKSQRNTCSSCQGAEFR